MRWRRPHDGGATPSDHGCPRARSLRVRLLLVILTTLGAFWVLWMAFAAWQMGRHQTGVWDSMLRDIATQIVLSMPTDIGDLIHNPRFVLPDSESYRGDKVSFQGWLRGGELVFQSPGVPGVPLKPDFVDGFDERRIDGDLWRVYAVSDASGTLQVQVGRSKSALLADIRHWTTLGLGMALLVLVLLKGAIWSVVHWSFRPVTALRESLRRRDPLDLEPLPTHHLPAEVRPLVDTFNQQLTRLDNAMQAERRFISDAAHELRTPLAALSTQLQLAMRAPTLELSRDAMAQLQTAIERSTRLAEQLLDQARLDAWQNGHEAQPIQLYEFVEMLVRDLESAATQRGQRIVLQLQPCVIEGHVDALGVLIRNLIDNAVRYAGQGGRIEVACHWHEREAGVSDVVLSVADDGPGVPQADRERIFDRFYRVLGSGERGSGIGLSLVSRIAQLHGASVEVGEGLRGRGLAVRVRFRGQAAQGALSRDQRRAASGPRADAAGIAASGMP